MSSLDRDRAESAALPLIFLTPPGWPPPTHRWVIASCGWVPPEGWTPIRGLAPAPRGWTWWTKNPGPWQEFESQAKQPAVRGIWIGVLVAVAGAIATAIGYSAAQTAGGTYLVFWGAVVFGIIQAIRSGLALSRVEDELWFRLVYHADQVREERNKAMYAAYLAHEGAR